MKNTKRFLRSKRYLTIVERYRYGWFAGYVEGMPFWVTRSPGDSGVYLGIERSARPGKLG